MYLTGNGKNVYPDELEALFAALSQVERATMAQDGNHFTMTLWFTGEEEAVRAAAGQLNESLPGYQKSSELIFVRDGADKRIK